MRKRILVVAPDSERRAALARLLIAAGYGVEVAEDARRASEVARSGDVDLVLVALDQHETTAPACARQVRDAVGALIIVTAPPDEDGQEILGRVKSALRSVGDADPPAQAPEVISFDGW